MQVVGYEAAVDGPGALRIAVDGAVRREELPPGGNLAYTLGERRCAGREDGGEHESCPSPDAPYCPDHSSAWPCARCRGSCGKPLPSCEEEHAVYLAAFAPDAFKVGVTRSWRLETRLREQGADRAAHVHTVSDGRIARELEAEIAADVGDRVRVPTKIRGLHRAVDDDAWRALLATFDVIREFSFGGDLALDSQPVPATLLSGTVLGTKGRVLAVERGGTTYAVDLRDLVGYELVSGASDRALQSSFDAFG